MTTKIRFQSLAANASNVLRFARGLPVRRMLLAAFLLPACLGLSACDLFGEEAEARASAARDAEGRAIGSGCRHSGRALEDCYTQNPRALKASVFAGWRDMDGYMRENNIAVVPPPDYRATMMEGMLPAVKPEAQAAAAPEPAAAAAKPESRIDKPAATAVNTQTQTPPTPPAPTTPPKQP
ncbi:conserved exported protein of unknown function [Sterolibacterium denitrificans]|uniref:Uncharacterized protein n=1 Tax=Sterolibacterium denitrificans TaxID=157592 RepID=A0A7Z7MVZ4_9PROT|nr:hypothetical protein [Sterolibacterium denitrificans]SMB29211.1 conserved exported protein of unknown function [Sterolibacterium denitrificans]